MHTLWHMRKTLILLFIIKYRFPLINSFFLRVINVRETHDTAPLVLWCGVLSSDNEFLSSNDDCNNKIVEGIVDKNHPILHAT